MTQDRPQDDDQKGQDPALEGEPAEQDPGQPSAETAVSASHIDRTGAAVEADATATESHPAAHDTATGNESATAEAGRTASEPPRKPASPTASAYDRFARFWWRDLLAALGFFTRLPVRAPAIPLSEAVRAFPLVGALVGLIGLLAYIFALRLGLSVLLAAVLAVTATAVLTGALHEDGLADLADMLGVRGDRERKLAVMRDSTIGSYGVLALVIATLFKVGAIADLAVLPQVASAMISAHVLSRAVLPVAMRSLPLARPNGLAVHAGKPPADSMYWALGLGVVIVLLVGGPGAAIVATVSALVTAFLVAKLAQRHIGGYTGDVLGAIQQVVEVAVLINFVTFS
ncbi:adenosylcobinamide-GDP ribazoletransferase [Dongia soli]|uniref:Adenosylcobinamide-GDP ribazoletransferase n=1 Tax=Dongia soli TaxID=600628 RepID=A0ABU5E5D2_9PROT|nr:adenosylcobinamide-GDP ribazoletransferase [Dongia soli]MDY0881408.1 adenosylcobinamide-GDP ribazoletransferase [Dongia soli]